MSARVKLALSYAVFLVISGGLLLAVVWVFLLRYVPAETHLADIWMPNRSDLAEAFAPKFALAFVALLVVGLAGGWLLAGRMLAPLEKIGDAARLAAGGSLSHRIRLAGPADEFSELADVFDEMLEQLEIHVAAQERFAANASHELRTPLAVTRTLIDVAKRDPDRDVERLLERLDSANTRAIELAEALLLLSKTSRGLVHTDLVDLSLAVEQAAEELLPLAERRGVHIEVTGEPVHVRGSAVLLQQLITNLLHNAVVHNVPNGGEQPATVAIHTAHHGQFATIIVENTGLDIPADLIPLLTEPFQRGTRRTRAPGADHVGAGLGLAIASNIVIAHHGDLHIEPRPGGGLNVTVRFAPNPASSH